jgi:Tfp pilus assembly protein PilO
VTILIALGLFFGYVNPTYTGEVARLHAEIESYDHALAAANEFKKKQSELTEERAKISDADIARLERYLPDGVDNVQLILDLDALANRSGVKLSDFEIDVSDDTNSGGEPAGLPVAAETVESITLGVSASGTYASFRTFLSGVEKSLRPLDLVALDISDSETGVYTYNMIFAIYWLR